MTTLRMQAHACDDIAAFSLRDETPILACLGGLLELSPAVAPQGVVFALVALLVALVQHRRSYSVTLGYRTGVFQLSRQMRGSLRWSIPSETDCDGDHDPDSRHRSGTPRKRHATETSSRLGDVRGNRLVLAERRNRVRKNSVVAHRSGPSPMDEAGSARAGRTALGVRWGPASGTRSASPWCPEPVQ
jgi:hypothetical protein